MPGGKCEPEDSHCRSGCGGRLCRRPYGTSRRGVTFIDPWPAHVEQMRKHGLRVTHAMAADHYIVACYCPLLGSLVFVRLVGRSRAPIDEISREIVIKLTRRRLLHLGAG